MGVRNERKLVLRRLPLSSLYCIGTSYIDLSPVCLCHMYCVFGMYAHNLFDGQLYIRPLLAHDMLNRTGWRRGCIENLPLIFTTLLRYESCIWQAG